MDAVRFGLDIDQRERLGLAWLVETCWVLRRPVESDLRGLNWGGPLEYWNTETETWGPREEATEWSEEQHGQMDAAWEYAKRICQGRGWWNREERHWK